MTTTTAMPAPTVARLDFALLQRVSFYFAVVNLFAAPFVPDPFSYAVGGMIPYALLSIIGLPTMPKGVAFFLLWQWAQAFSRALQSVFDGESMADGTYGPDVLPAYWYALCSLIVLALAFRLGARRDQAADRPRLLRSRTLARPGPDPGLRWSNRGLRLLYRCLAAGGEP